MTVLNYIAKDIVKPWWIQFRYFYANSIRCIVLTTEMIIYKQVILIEPGTCMAGKQVWQFASLRISSFVPFGYASCVLPQWYLDTWMWILFIVWTSGRGGRLAPNKIRNKGRNKTITYWRLHERSGIGIENIQGKKKNGCLPLKNPNKHGSKN